MNSVETDDSTNDDDSGGDSTKLLRPGLIEGECVENILHNGRCCADVTAQMRRSVLTIPLGSPRSPFSISPQC